MARGNYVASLVLCVACMHQFCAGHDELYQPLSLAMLLHSYLAMSSFLLFVTGLLIGQIQNKVSYV